MVTKDEMALLGNVAIVIKDYFKEMSDPMLRRLDVIEARLNEIGRFTSEQRVAPASMPKAAAVPYGGTWRSAEQCQAGKFYTHNGSLWYAVTDSHGVEPGRHCGEFKLAVKSGHVSRLEPAG